MRGALVTAQRAHAELERLGDEYGAVWALRLIGNFQGWLGRSGDAERTWKDALELAEHVSPRLRDEIRGWLLWEAWWGPPKIPEGIARCDDYLDEARRSGYKRFEAIALEIRAALKAWQGSFDEARADMSAGRALSRELGDMIWWASSSMLEADLEFGAGDPQAAYDVLAEGHEVLAAHAETGFLATVVGMRSQAAFLLGRDAEALELADEVGRLSSKDDFEPRSRIALVRALVIARRGDFDRADELLQEAANLIEPTDYIFLHIGLNEARGEISRLAGRPVAERAALERALAVAEEKGHLVAAARAMERLAEL